MTVKELKELIANLPDEMQVILQKDTEGNGYSPLCDVDAECVYVPENTYSGEVYRLDNTAKDVGMNKDEWDEIKAMPRCVVLCPIN